VEITHANVKIIMRIAAAKTVNINLKTWKFTLNVRTPLSHLENCKNYVYMILLP